MTKEERREYMRVYRRKNRYKINEYQREWHRTHRDYDKEYYEQHKEKINAYCREYYKDCKWQWQDIYRPRQVKKGASEETK